MSDHSLTLQRLRWQCRRGLLELDYIFQDYLEQRYTHTSAEQQQQFLELLDHQDPDLQAWLLNGEPGPEHLMGLIRELRCEG